MDRIAGCAFWAFIFLVRIAYKDSKTALAEREYKKQLNPPPPIPLVHEKRLEYFVNGRKIPCAFERYYWVKLNMALPIMNIEQAIIERRYLNRIEDEELDINYLKDVVAANKFFNDRLAYLSYLN